MPDKIIPVKEDWLDNLANFDALDMLFIFGGFPLAISQFGTFGLLLGGMIYIFQAVFRKTPVAINTINLLTGLRNGDNEAINTLIADTLPVISVKEKPSRFIETVMVEEKPAQPTQNGVRLAKPTDKVHIWIADVERDMP